MKVGVRFKCFYLNNMEKISIFKKHLILKIFLSLLPALIFAYIYSLMTLENKAGLVFWLIWILMIWNVWQFTEKSYIQERLIRLTEISFFLLPVSAIIFSFVFGSESEGAAEAIGSAIGGMIVTVILFIVGLSGGVITHLIAGKYEKKADKSKNIQVDTLSSKHGIILSVAGIFLLALVFGVGNQNPVDNTKEEDSSIQESISENREIKNENIASEKGIAPTINILSSDATQGANKEYLLEFEIKNAEKIKVFLNNYKKFEEKDITHFSETLPLEEVKNTIEILAFNGELETQEVLIITRDKTEEDVLKEENAKKEAETQERKKIEQEKKQAEEAKKWEQSKAGKLCQKYPTWSKNDCSKVADGRYWIGISYEMLVESMGSKPNSANPSNYGYGTQWQWCWYNYTPSCFYDNDDDGLIDSYN